MKSRNQTHARMVVLAMASVLTLGAITGCEPAPPSSPPSARASGPRLALEDWTFSASAVRGQAVYTNWCVGCHGPEGDGAGPAAALLDPRPRNFQKGYFKFRTTPSGRLPTVEDVMRTVMCGLPGSSMPAFPLVPEPERRDVSQYVIELAWFGKAAEEVAYMVANEEASLEEIKQTKLSEIRTRVRTEYHQSARPFPVPTYPDLTPESVEKGRARYMKECANCHGASGRGDGGSAYTLRDWESAAILPRDFTTGVFRAGSSGRDLYIRLKSGLNGTPMPSIDGDDEDLWALVHFMQSLKDPAARPPKTGCATAEEHP